jgi:hypothetical protein
MWLKEAAQDDFCFAGIAYRDLPARLFPLPES